MNYKVYADNAATERMRIIAEGVYSECVSSAWGNASSNHQVGWTAEGRLDAARFQVGLGIGAGDGRVVFTSGATESINIALKSLFEYGAKTGKRHCVIFALEHNAVLSNAAYFKERLGFEITYVYPDEGGIVTSEAVRSCIRSGETCFVCVMYVNNEIGSIQPVKEIGELCRNEGVIYFCDATQAVGHIVVNAVKDNIDVMCFSGHKFGGGYGAGCLYFGEICRDVIQPLTFRGKQENGYRAGTENVPAICAMAAALSDFNDKAGAEMQYIRSLKNQFIDRIEKEIPGVKINGKRDYLTPGIVNIQFEGINAETLILMLNTWGISVSSGSACRSGETEPSYVLEALGLNEQQARSSIRFSFSHFTTVEEIRYVADTLKMCVETLKRC